MKESVSEGIRNEIKIKNKKNKKIKYFFVFRTHRQDPARPVHGAVSPHSDEWCCEGLWNVPGEHRFDACSFVRLLLLLFFFSCCLPRNRHIIADTVEMVLSGFISAIPSTCSLLYRNDLFILETKKFFFLMQNERHLSPGSFSDREKQKEQKRKAPKMSLFNKIEKYGVGE